MIRYRRIYIYIIQSQIFLSKFKLENSNINLDVYRAIYEDIAYGYEKAYQLDMQTYRVTFGNKFKIDERTPESLVAFYHELLLHGAMEDLHKAQSSSYQYFRNIEKNITRLSPEYFVFQITETFNN